MKIAIVDQTINYGGGSRVLRKLLKSFLELDEDIKIDLYGNPEGFEREEFFKFKKNKKLNLIELKSLKLNSNQFAKNYKINKIFEILRNKFPSLMNLLPDYMSGNLKKELEKKLVNYDAVYFPWPFLIELPKINIPIFATFHDFNYKYYFNSSPIFSKKRSEHLNKHFPIWLKNATPIVSNNFIKSEINKFYPSIKKKIHVIYLASYSEGTKVKSKIKKNYIIYPTNLSPHKNLGPLIVGFNYLTKKIKNIKLILTGPSTEKIKGRSSSIGLELTKKNPNVLGLGYVNYKKIERLISEAKILVSSEIYTSDNGPCTDGWYHGVPVACSNIPSNKEHLNFQKVHAELFDPYDPKDIYKKLFKVLKNEKKYSRLAKISSNNIIKYTWNDVAKNYVDLFKTKLKN